MTDLELSKRLLAFMIYARGVDQAAARLYSKGLLSLWLSCSGQEAAQVGSILAVGDDTYVFPSYRDHAAALARGITAHQLLHQWTARSFCGWSPNSVNFHPYNLVIAGHLLHAVGYAMGLRIKASNGIVLTYFGDGATSQGDFSEALNLAAVKGAPVLFFCQNNGWALSTPVRDQMKTSVADKARGLGVEAMSVDGNNVFEVYDSTVNAVEFIRSASAPFLIEAQTMRISGHSITDAPELYRSADDIEHWVDRDPIKRATEYLAQVPEFSFEWLQTTQAAVDSFCDKLGRTDPSGECLDDKSSVFEVGDVR
jgi:2-oxoisovalerate dehydrogenase E1 component alpha subunit